MNRATVFFLLICAFIPAQAEISAFETELESRVGDIIPVMVFPATGTDLVLWLNSEWGFSPRQIPSAEGLARQGVEVWIPDLHAAWFLPIGRYSLLEVEPFILADLVNEAVEKTGKRVFVMASGRVAALALTGAHSWRREHQGSDKLGGAILFHPMLYRRTPQGGESAEYLPIVRAANLPIYLIQPEQAASYWRVGKLIESLQSGGSNVFLHRIAGVGNGFNIRPEFQPSEAALTAKLPQILKNAIQLLSNLEHRSVDQPLLEDALATPERTARSDLLRLHPTPGPAPSLRLPDLKGRIHDVAQLKGNVVVINFWATWCPPCIAEIPSLRRLHDQLQPKGLQLLTINVGESAARVKQFLADKSIRFPVLLDTNGEAFRHWHAYAFPTTMVLDDRHMIRYAVFGAMAWDSPEVIKKIEALLAVARR